MPAPEEDRSPPPEDKVYDYYSKFVADENKARLYSLFNPGELYMRQERERATLRLLKQVNRQNFSNQQILEVGCGRGHQIGEYIRWGAWPENIAGIDILPEFIEEAQRRYPKTSLQIGSALELPYADGSFDIVSQSTVMSSLPENSQRSVLAKEMVRVLKPNGLILWSDFRYNSPGNQNVRKVTQAEIKELFDGLDIVLESTTLLPPIVRRVAPFSHALTSLLDTLPFLHSHLRGVFVKRAHMP